MTNIKPTIERIRHKSKYIWILLGVASVLLNAVMSSIPDWVDKYYFRGVFQLIRWTYDHSLGYLPIPMVYITFVIFIIYAARVFTQMIRQNTNTNWAARLLEIVLVLLAFLGSATFCFYLFWGFNYNRPDIYTELQMESQPIDSMYLIEEVQRVTEDLIHTRALISDDSLTAISFSDIPNNLESLIREEQEKLLRSWDIPTYGRVRVRKLAPKGILLRFSTAGVYIPYAFEGHIDSGLHPIQWPFTMAHEMAHGYGYGDEGTCNFIGYLSCMESDNPMLRYSAIRAYWRYLMSDLRQIDKDLYRVQMVNLPQSIKTDLNEIIKYMDRYSDILPELRNKVYDSYLKSQGVKAGLANYSHMIKYLRAYKEGR